MEFPFEVSTFDGSSFAIETSGIQAGELYNTHMMS